MAFFGFVFSLGEVLVWRPVERFLSKNSSLQSRYHRLSWKDMLIKQVMEEISERSSSKWQNRRVVSQVFWKSSNRYRYSSHLKKFPKCTFAPAARQGEQERTVTKRSSALALTSKEWSRVFHFLQLLLRALRGLLLPPRTIIFPLQSTGALRPFRGLV